LISCWCWIGNPKKIVGYDAGTPCTARHWLTALDMAVNRQCPQGARDQGVALMRAHGGQPTAITFMEACRALGIQQALTSYHNPKLDFVHLRGIANHVNEAVKQDTWNFYHVGLML
jgi:transposase InsO family protein